MEQWRIENSDFKPWNKTYWPSHLQEWNMTSRFYGLEWSCCIILLWFTVFWRTFCADILLHAISYPFIKEWRVCKKIFLQANPINHDWYGKSACFNYPCLSGWTGALVSNKVPALQITFYLIYFFCTKTCKLNRLPGQKNNLYLDLNMQITKWLDLHCSDRCVSL